MSCWELLAMGTSISAIEADVKPPRWSRLGLRQVDSLSIIGSVERTDASFVRSAGLLSFLTLISRVLGLVR